MTDINIEIIYRMFFPFFPSIRECRRFIVGEIEGEKKKKKIFSPRRQSWTAGETRWIGSFPIGSSMSPGLMSEYSNLRTAARQQRLFSMNEQRFLPRHKFSLVRSFVPSLSDSRGSVEFINTENTSLIFSRPKYRTGQNGLFYARILYVF